MDDNTSEGLQTSSLSQRLESMRKTLWLQWSQMDRAWQNHNPADGNMDTDVLAKLGAIVEATRVAVAHVLRISGDAIQRTEWRSTATVDPVLVPYTALSDFHCRVMTSTHPNSIHARRPTISGGRSSNASGSGLSGHVTREVTSTGRLAVRQREISIRPQIMYVCNEVESRGTKTTPPTGQAVKPPIVPLVKASNTVTVVE